LKLIHKNYPGYTTSVLISDKDKRTLEQQLAELGYTPEMYSPHYSLVTPELVNDCHRRGIRIIPWTVDTLEEMKKLKDMGVDGIITDYPDYFSQL
jgi:glycerophosphoryl diester phosphodiesterase